jgi:TonB family protein
MKNTASDEPGAETMAALVSPGHRRLRVAMLLVLDAALLGVGGTFIARFLFAPPKAIAQTQTQTRTPTETRTLTPTLTETMPPPTVTPPPARTIPKQETPPTTTPAPVVHHTHKHPARLRGVKVPKPKPKLGTKPTPLADPGPFPPPPPGINPTPAPPPPTTNNEPPPPSPQPPASAEIEEDNVRFVVQHHLPQVQSCYERALKQDARLEGVIELQFTLQPDGTATAAHSVANSTGNEGLATCLSHLVESWQFPRPADGPLDFVYPFAFAGGG